MVVVVSGIRVVILVRIVVIVGAVSADGELRTIVLGPTASNRHQDRLVIRRTGHGANAVVSGRKTSIDFGGKQALPVTDIVDAFEESESRSIRSVTFD